MPATEYKITQETSSDDAIKLMGGGKSLARDICKAIIRDGKKYDPQAGNGNPFFYLLYMDDLGLYAEDMANLYEVYCKCQFGKFLAVIRAFQLEILDRDVLDAILDEETETEDGTSVPKLDDVVTQVEDQLWQFSVAGQSLGGWHDNGRS